MKLDYLCFDFFCLRGLHGSDTFSIFTITRDTFILKTLDSNVHRKSSHKDFQKSQCCNGHIIMMEADSVVKQVMNRV